MSPKLRVPNVQALPLGTEARRISASIEFSTCIYTVVSSTCASTWCDEAVVRILPVRFSAAPLDLDRRSRTHPSRV